MVLHGLFILVAILLFGPVGSADPPGATLDLWGEIVGTRPRDLSISVEVGAGVVSGRDLVVTTAAGFAAYSVKFDLGRIDPWSQADRPPRLRVQSGGTLLGSLDLAGDGSDVVHLVDGQPRAPMGSVLLARCEASQTPEQETRVALKTVIANRAGHPLEGVLRWISVPDGHVIHQQGCPLPARSLSVKRSTIVTRDPDLSGMWQVQWRPGTASVPGLIGIDDLSFQDAVLVDTLGSEGVLTALEPMQPDAGGYLIQTDETSITMGSWISIHMQSSLQASRARTILATWALEGWTSDDDVGLSLPLDVAVIQDVPGGSWCRGTWMSPATVDVTRFRLVSKPGARLPGSWMVRHLATARILSREQEF